MMHTTPVDPLSTPPAPWKLQGRAWILPLEMPKDTPCDQLYAPQERGTPYADPAVNGVFVGGSGRIWLARYTASDIGPYDEIMFVPGSFRCPLDGKAHPRITTIYVSSEVALRNGRSQWGTPKYLAKFSFATDPVTKATNVSISSLEKDAAPFFQCTLTLARFVPSFYVPLSLPSPSVVQPPIPHPTEEGSMFLGCSNWISTPLKFCGWAHIANCKGGLEGGKYGDGDAFPDFRPKNWALEVPNCTGIFPEGKVMTEKQK